MIISSDISFKEITHMKKRKLLFWGAGKKFDIFQNSIKNEGFNLIPDKIIDNDVQKRHTTKVVLDTKVDIVTWDDIQIENDENIVIILTLKNHQEVINQLKACCRDENIYILTYEDAILRYREYEIENKKLLFPLKRTDKPVIPKIIHYFWFGGNPMPEKNKKYIEGWKEQCPDYEIKEWNESNYDISKCLYMRQAWESKYWAFVSDYARLDVVYEYGGIYLDTDVEVLRNLDDLLYQEAYLGFESNLYIATGLGFVARKNHPIIKRMRDDYDARIFKKQDGAFNLVACPAYQTNYLKGYGLITNGQHQYIGDITIYPASVLCSYCYQSKKEIRTQYSYTMHHYDASWSISKLKDD